MYNKPMKLRGLPQAVAVTAYCSTVGALMFNANKIFGATPGGFFGPVVFLLLFSTSALICGLIVFYKPYKLFFAKKRAEAIDQVVGTTIYLAIFAITFLFLAVTIK